MRKYKGKHLQESEPKNLLTNSVRVVWFILINAVAWIWCSYLLAYLDRTETAEELSKVALTAIVAVVLGYYGKALTENLSKHNKWPDKDSKKTNKEQSKPYVDFSNIAEVSSHFSPNATASRKVVPTAKCEATKMGLVPKSTSKEDIDEFRNSVDPDMMGFDGEEAEDLSAYEEDGE